MPLPKVIADWFAAKGWAPRKHQLDVLAAWDAGASAMLIAPTGAGKTLAGFLPTLDRSRRTTRSDGHPHSLHLAAEGAGRRRRAQPHDADRGDEAADQGRDAHRRHARRIAASASAATRRNILLTTPEQLALLLSHERERQDSSPASAHRPRRAPFARHQQARRAAVARHRAAREARARAAHHRAQRHRGAPRPAARLDRARRCPTPQPIC